MVIARKPSQLAQAPKTVGSVSFETLLSGSASNIRPVVQKLFAKVDTGTEV